MTSRRDVPDDHGRRHRGPARVPFAARRGQRHDQGRPRRLRRPGPGRGREHLRGRRHELQHQAPRLGDVFADHLEQLPSTTSRSNDLSKDKFDVPNDRSFVGFDAYQKVIDVLRPRHPGHAARLPARSTSRPSSRPARTSSPRSRSPSTAPASARSWPRPRRPRRRSLAVVAGTQRRHQAGYIETHEADPRRRDRRHPSRPRSTGTRGASGRSRAKPDWTDIEYQLRNWYYFTWLSRRPHRRAARPQPRRRQLGDRQATPTRCVGMGGRAGQHRPRVRQDLRPLRRRLRVPQRRPSSSSQARQIDGCDSDVSEIARRHQGHLDAATATASTAPARASRRPRPRGSTPTSRSTSTCSRASAPASR